MKSQPIMILVALLGVHQIRAQTATVDFTSRLQEIDGFGASSALRGVLNAKELDAAFFNGNQNQLGLSILSRNEDQP